METLFKVIALALITQVVWQSVKLIWRRKKFDWQRLAIILLSVGVCFVYQADLFIVLDINTTIPFVGIILTGVIVSRGANMVHDLFKQIFDFRKQIMPSDKT